MRAGVIPLSPWGISQRFANPWETLLRICYHCTNLYWQKCERRIVETGFVYRNKLISSKSLEWHILLTHVRIWHTHNSFSIRREDRTGKILFNIIRWIFKCVKYCTICVEYKTKAASLEYLCAHAMFSSINDENKKVW